MKNQMLNVQGAGLMSRGMRDEPLDDRVILKRPDRESQFVLNMLFSIITNVLVQMFATGDLKP